MTPFHPADRIRSHLPAPVLARLRLGKRFMRSLLRRFRRRFQKPVNQARLMDQLRAVGIDRGDVLCVHSSLSRMGKIDGGPTSVIRALQETVGPEGSVMMPCFASAQKVLDDFNLGRLTDLRQAKSETGLIPEIFRNMPGVRRSSHPFSSMCAWGAHARDLTGSHHIDPRICHRHSPLGRLHALHGKVVGIGVSIGPVSFYHVLEDTWAGYPLDFYLPPAIIAYIDNAGQRIERPVKRYDSKRTRTRIDKPDGAWIRQHLEAYLRGRNILQDFRLGHAAAWVMASERLYDELRMLAARGVTIYSIPQDFPEGKFPV